MSQQTQSKPDTILFKHAPAPMWLQQGSIVIDANSRALDLFQGPGSERLIGTDITTLLSDCGQDGGDASLEALALFRDVENGNDATADWRCRKPDGSQMDLHTEMSPVDLDGQRFILIVAFDQSRLNRDREAMQTQRRQMQDFIGNFSHELRTSLFSILGFTSVLRQDEAVLDTGQFREFLSILNIETLKISSLVEDVLSLSRITAGAGVLKKRPADLIAILEELAGTMAEQATRNGVTLNQKLPDGPLTLVMDPDAIKRVFFNLIDNAVKHTPMGGWIELRADADTSRSSIIVKVIDSGLGIPARDLPHVFEQFYRVERSGFTPNGYGLGLSIAKQIVDAHEGSIAIESDEGAGTTITVVIPFSNGIDGMASLPISESVS